MQYLTNKIKLTIFFGCKSMGPKLSGVINDFRLVVPVAFKGCWAVLSPSEVIRAVDVVSPLFAKPQHHGISIYLFLFFFFCLEISKFIIDKTNYKRKRKLFVPKQK